MPPETALIESRALRDSVMGRTEALAKVKALALLPDGLHVTTRMVADYFEVGERVVNKLIQRHRSELGDNGFVVLRGADLERFKGDSMSLYPGGQSESYPQARSNLALFTRRAVLNVAMLLRDSDIARRVRTYLLDAEETSRAGLPHQAPADDVLLAQLWEAAAVKIGERILNGPIGARFAALETRQDNTEACLERVTARLVDLSADVHRVGSSLMELGPILSRISTRLERVERRLDATHDVIGAMSERMAVLSEDMKVVKSMAHRHD